MILKKTFYFWGIALLLIVIFLPGYTKLQELREKNRDLETKVKQLHSENYLLEQELKRVASDPFYQEKIAREKTGIVRRNEIPVKIVTEENR